MGLIRIEFIGVEGFGSYTAMEMLFLDGKGVTAIVGANGSGKSTIASKALSWCLYGKTAPERMGSGTGTLKAKDIVNSNCDEATVKVGLRKSGDDDRRIVIERNRKKRGKDTIKIDDMVVQQGDVDALLGATYEVFTRTCLRGQGDPWNWAEATELRKREIIDSISGASELQEPYDKARKIANNRKQTLQIYEARLKDARDRVFDLDDLKMKVEGWSFAQEKEIEACENEIASLEAAYAEAVQGDSDLAAMVPAQPPTLDLEPYENAVIGATTRHRQAENALIELETQLGMIAELEAGQGCPTCGQTVPEGSPAIVSRESLKAQVATQRQVVAGCKMHLDETRKALTGAVEWLDGQKDAFAAKQRREPVMKAAVDTAKARLTALRAAMNPWTAALGQMMERNQATERDIALLEEARSLASTDLYLADAWVQVLAPQGGVRAQLAEATLEAIEREASRWLELLSDGAMSIEITHETPKGKPQIGIVITHRNEERNLLSLSGGEKRRINLAVDLAISQVFSASGALPISLLVLDEEVFSGMDNAGKKAVARCLAEAGVEDVVLIDHDPALASVFERTVEVVLDGGRSILAGDT